MSCLAMMRSSNPIRHDASRCHKRYLIDFFASFSVRWKPFSYIFLRWRTGPVWNYRHLNYTPQRPNAGKKVQFLKFDWAADCYSKALDGNQEWYFVRFHMAFTISWIASCISKLANCHLIIFTAWSSQLETAFVISRLYLCCCFLLAFQHGCDVF